MSRICPMFSSSKGNATYFSGGGTSLLVDAGVSLRQLKLALQANNVTPDQLDGVLITHEHSDHIRGLPMLLKYHPLPVYASSGTLAALMAGGHLPPGTSYVEMNGPVTIGSIEVTPFDTPHDASHSLGYRFSFPDGRTAALATDLGYVSDTVRDHITGCDLVMLESNYDPHMLEVSPYPWSLKRRIKGSHGHLSNEECAAECRRLVQEGTTRLVLAHLSEQNNMPALARQLTQSCLEEALMEEQKDYILHVAPARGTPTMIVF